MTVRWFKLNCHECRGASEKLCVKICPGNLLECGSNGIYMREPAECWDCAACVKACPREALALELSPVLGGDNSRLFAKSTREDTRWRLVHEKGEDTFILPARKVIMDNVEVR